jgi:hypothetical protein
MTAEVVEPFPGGQFTTERVSFITDDILVQRYVEIDGHLKKVLAVVKMRGSNHDTNFRIYNLTATGAVLGESLDTSHGITTGVPTLTREHQSSHPGLTDEESVLLEAVVRLKRVSAAQLAKQTGLTTKAVRTGLERLTALGFVDEDGKEENTYRAVARPHGT